MLLKTLLPLTIATAPLTAQTPQDLPQDVADAVGQISQSITKEAMPSILTLDTDGDGSIPHKELLQGLINRGFAKVSQLDSFNKGENSAKKKRAMEGAARIDRIFIKALKPNEQGNISEKEFAHGLAQLISLRIAKSITLDENKDGKLNLKEYALSSPVTQGESVDAEGFTKKQISRFNSNDKDHNGFIEGEEFIPNRELIQASVVTTVSALLIDHADTDNDGNLSNEELLSIAPDETPLPEPLPLTDSIHWLRALSPEEIPLVYRNLLAAAK